MEIDRLIELIKRHIGAVPFNNLSSRFASVPNGVTLQDLEQFASNPVRIRQGITVDSSNDFCRYVNRFKNSASTIFVNPTIDGLNGELARCVIDYHHGAEFAGEGVPCDNAAEWGTHIAVLRAIPSPEYALLLGLHKKGMMAQAEFALVLRDIAPFIVSHESAEILEVARTINLTSKGDFKRVDDDFSGSVDFRYDLQVGATAGTQEHKLTVPNQVSFLVPLLLGGDVVEITAELRYRIPQSAGAPLLLGIFIADKLWIERAAIEHAKDHIAETTELMVLTGVPK